MGKLVTERIAYFESLCNAKPIRPPLAQISTLKVKKLINIYENKYTFQKSPILDESFLKSIDVLENTEIGYEKITFGENKPIKDLIINDSIETSKCLILEEYFNVRIKIDKENIVTTISDTCDSSENFDNENENVKYSLENSEDFYPEVHYDIENRSHGKRIWHKLEMGKFFFIVKIRPTKIFKSKMRRKREKRCRLKKPKNKVYDFN